MTTILVLFTYGVSLNTWKEKGLIEREIRYYRELIDKKNCNFIFLTYGDSTDFFLKEKNIEIYPIYAKFRKPKSIYLSLVHSFLLPFFVSKDFSKVDVIKSNQMLGSWVGAILSRLLNKPLIIRSGYELYDFAIKAKKSYFYRLFVFIISHFSYKSAKRIHVATLRDKAFITDYFSISSSKIFIYPNFIDTLLFRPMRIRHNKKLLFVGRMNKQKNIPLLFRALKGLDIELDIIGSGEEEKNLRLLSRKLNIKVNFLGVVPNEKMPAIYNKYEAYILTSRYEGNPKTLLEAMACGCRVIGTDVDGINNILIHNQNGILAIESEIEIRKAIKSVFLKSDISLLRQISLEARKFIKDNHSLEHIVNMEKDAYNCIRSSKIE